MRNKGIAIVLALATVLVVSGIGTLIFTRTIREIRHGAQDQGIVQTLMLARGAANLGGSLLATRGRERLERIVQQTASSTDRWAYGGNTGTEAPDPVLVAQALANVADRFQSDLDGFLCGKNFAPDGLPAEVRVRVYVTTSACGEPLPQRPTSPRGASWRGRPGQGREAGSARPTPFPSSWWPRPPWARPAATSCSRESTASPSDAPASPGTPCSPTCTPFPTGPGSGLPTAPSLTAPCTPTATSASTGARGSAGR